MLNFRNTNIVFSTLLVLMIGTHLVVGLPIYLYAILLFTYSVVLFYGCTRIDSGFFLPVICAADTNRKEVAISFDDGPAPHHTPAILQLLKQENVKAAFFCIGSRIENNEALLQQISDEGHIIGNHSFSHHFWFDMFTSKKMLAEMQQMDMAVKAITGLRPKLFRPPYGVVNPNVKKAIVQGGYTPVGWSVRSMDTVAKDEQKLFDKISAGIKPGAVFLFHDTCSITVQVLPRFIQEVKNKGYHIVPLDKLLHLTPYA